MNKVQQKTKPTLQSITGPPNEVLGTMIKAIESEVGSIDSIEELAQIINKRFNIQVSTNDLYNFYMPRICEEEVEVYTLFGYERTF